MALPLTLAAVFLTAPSYAAEKKTYDLVVVGAGTGGVAAAVQAGRSGLSVALVEPSDFVGGQISRRRSPRWTT